MTVTHNKEVDNAIRDLAQSLKGEKKKKLMCIVVELGNRVRECEKYRGETKKKGGGPVLSDYAKRLVQKKTLDEIANKAKTTETDLEAYIDPSRVNCNQNLK